MDYVTVMLQVLVLVLLLLLMCYCSSWYTRQNKAMLQMKMIMTTHEAASQ